MRIVAIDADGVAHAVAWRHRVSLDHKKAWEDFKHRLREINEAVWADDQLIAVKGENNYRDTLYPEYKGTRKGDPGSAIIVKQLRERAVRSGIVVPSYGREADDLLRIWSIEAKNAGHEIVIAANDKDLFCIPGKHYNIRTDKLTTINEQDAERHYWQQILKGDPVDNIPGLPGVGPKKAASLLSDCFTTAEYKARVKELYKQYYKEDWKNYLLSNGKMIHIQQNVNDYFEFKEE